MSCLIFLNTLSIFLCSLNLWFGLYYHLGIASSYGYAEIAALLVNAGANVNARNDQHETPLHDAASEGSLEIVKLLLENGAYVNARDRSKQTAFSYAYRDRGFSEHKQAIMDLLESAGA